MKLLFEVQQLVQFALQHARNGNAGPTRHDLGDVFLVHFLFEQAVLFVLPSQARLFFLQRLFETNQRAPLQLRRLVEIVGALGDLDVVLHLFDLLAQRTQPLHAILLTLPAALERIGVFVEREQLLFNARQTLVRGVVPLLLQSFPLNLELQDAPHRFIERGRHGVDLSSQLRRRFVHQVDGFVRQEAVRNVTVGEHGGRHQGSVFDAYAVVDFVALFQPAQDGNRVLYRRLIDDDRLEAALQRGVFFDVLAIFVQRRGADAMQLAAGEHGLQQIAGVHGAFCLPRPDHRVELVDEENDLPFARLDLFQNRL